MEEQNSIERLVSNVKLYAESRIDLAIINVQDKISDVCGTIVSYLLIAVFAFFVLLFLSVGCAWYIGERTGDPSMGFFSLAGFYMLLVLVFYFAKDKLVKTPVVNSIIKKITINEED